MGAGVRSFLFHVYASGDFFADAEGCACDSLRQAKRHALRFANTVVAMAPRSYDWRRWSVLVAEADGPALLAVPFPPPSRAGRRDKAGAAAARRRPYPKVVGPGEAITIRPPANDDHLGPVERIRRAAVTVGRQREQAELTEEGGLAGRLARSLLTLVRR